MFLLACGDPAGGVVLADLEQPILRGVVDEDHSAVMLLASRAGFLCSGTVIHVEQGSGFLLTAGHCVTEESPRGGALVPIAASDFVVVPGTDFAEGTLEYPVDTVSVEPSYDGSFAADVAVLRFSFGADPAPSVIEPLSSDEDRLAVADALLLVGFGQTEVDEGNTERRRVERQVDALDEELVVYSQEDGKGACFGDSGGPVLATLGGQERVAAVISGGVDDTGDGCSGGLGVAMRVSAYEGFIQGALAAGAG
jgi:secreted trypsin-like serine protease